MNAKVEAVLHYTMDPVVAKLVINRQLRNEKREITVLFADLENFTTHMETVPPEVAVSDLNRLFTSMEPILTLYKGHLDKYIGDGMMAEFGVPYFSESHALLASLAGLKMQARMAQRDFPWKMRLGISTGPALVGLMGSDNRKNYTALGDTVNLASRLQALCPVGGVCVDERTHKAVARWFHTRRIRAGLSTLEIQKLEDDLAALDELLNIAPRVDHCLRAAELCALLGEPKRALEYERKALELEPSKAESIQRSVGRLMLSGEENSQIHVKGKKRPVAAFRSEERRVGKECRRLCRSRWSPYH
jgi:class 3 adenylate cyclase